MNLWVKRAGQLVIWSAAVFFFSCEDEVSEFGVPNPIPKFDIKYVEIPLESSQYLLDSINTTNPGNSNRLLVGNYTDPAIGKIHAAAYAQLYPGNLFPTTVNVDTIHVDSVSLQLRFDMYAYGAAGNTRQSFTIHELETPILYDSAWRYTTKHKHAYSPDVLSSNSYFVPYDEFKLTFDKATKAKSDLRIINFKLGAAMAARVESMIKDKTNKPLISGSFNFSTFRNSFPGFAIVPGASNDKIVGFDVANTLGTDTLLTRMVVYYNGKFQQNFAMYYVGTNDICTSYSTIETEFNGELSSLTQPYAPLDPDPDNRYIQAGTGLAVRLDLSKFFEFADTVQRMQINSAELVISDVPNTSQFFPLNSLTMITLDKKNDIRYRRTNYVYRLVRDPNTGKVITLNKEIATSDQTELSNYVTLDNGSAVSWIADNGGFFTPLTDGKAAATLAIRDGNTYYTYITRLLQKFYQNTPENRYYYFGLGVGSPDVSKNVNRIVFNKNNLRLRVYYTTPK